VTMQPYCGCANKNTFTLEKKIYISAIVAQISAHLSDFVSIHTTYSADFIETTDVAVYASRSFFSNEHAFAH